MLKSQPPEPAGVARKPDPGSRRAALIAWIVTAILFGAVVYQQQARIEPPAAVAAPDPNLVSPPKMEDPFYKQLKMMVQFNHFIAEMGQPSGPTLAPFLPEVPARSSADVDRFRLAIAVDDLLGTEAGLKQLDGIQQPRAGLVADITTLRRLWGSAAEVLTPEEKQRLIDQHGWFGQVLSVRGLKASDPQYQAVFQGLGTQIGFMVFAMLLLMLALVGGIVAFVVAMVQLSRRKVRWHFVPPAPGGSVYLEILPVFLGGFCLLRIGIGLMGKYAVREDGTAFDWVAPVQLLSQWSLAAVPFWPLLRGVSFVQLKADMGWHRGAGFWREVGCGFLGYFAGLPLYFAMAAIVAVYMFSTSSEGFEMPENPVVEMVKNTNPLTLVLLAALATLWAPLVEESVFRGALYRHLRSRTKVVVATIVSALFFGLMHSYPGVVVLMPASLGAVFGVMREWRGSLISSVTAHWLHNTTILLVVILSVSMMKG